MTSKITYTDFTSDPFESLDVSDDTKGAYHVVKWAYDTYGDEIVYACSFGAEGIVLINLISQVKPDARIVFLDTGLHFDETYDLIDRVKAKYPKLNIVMKKPDLTLDQQAQEYGGNLWRRDPNQCCYIRKVKPLEEVLTGQTAWVSGLRR